MNKAKIYPWIFAVVLVLIIILHSGVVSAEEEYEELWDFRPGVVGIYDEADVAISPDGEYIVIVTDSVHFFNKKGELLWRKYIPAIPGKLELGYTTITNVAISRNGNYISGIAFADDVRYLNKVGDELTAKPDCDWYYGEISLDGNYKVEVKHGFAVNSFHFLVKLNKIASDKISDAKSAISSTKSKGVIVTEAEDLLSKAEQAFDAKDYKNAKEFAQKAVDHSNKLDEDAKSAEEVIKVAKSGISDGKSKGFKLTEAENLLSEAENAFNFGDYTNAKSLAEQAKEKAEEINKLAAPANDAVDDAKSAIHNEKPNFYSAEAEFLLSQAEQAFKVGNYEEAKSLAENATNLALDIDQDGVKNEEDFAPTIKNIYIYTGTPIALLVLAALTKVSLDVRKKRKIKRLEKQRIRREEERRRLEYERRVKEVKAKYEQYKREGYAPDKDLEGMLK